MTLDTRIYVHSRVDYREVFVKCNQLIGAHEGIAFKDEPGMIWNKPGQGLCAFLDVTHGDGAPLREPGEHAKYCDGEAGECFAPCGVPCWLEVSFDTSYGYSGPEGGCGNLHARLVAELGQWLDGKGVRWRWRNEFTSEIHWGYDRLTDLCDGGAEATAWFADIVQPAIAAIAAGDPS
jgi:hypothetical protein